MATPENPPSKKGKKPNFIPEYLQGIDLGKVEEGVSERGSLAAHTAWEGGLRPEQIAFLEKGTPLGIAMFAFSESREILKHEASEGPKKSEGTRELDGPVLAWGIIHPMIHIDYYEWLRNLSAKEEESLKGTPKEIARFAFLSSRRILREAAHRGGPGH